MKPLIEIKQLCKKRGLTQEQLAEKIGMTRSGVQNIFNTNTTSIQTLQKISDVLEIPMIYWFDESDNCLKEPIVNYGKVNSNHNSNHINVIIDNKDKEIENLKEKIELLEKTIKDKDHIIHWMEISMQKKQ